MKRIEQAKEHVLNATRKAARSVGKGLNRAIRVAAEYARHLHKDDGVPKPKAVAVGARAVLNTIRKRR